MKTATTFNMPLSWASISLREIVRQVRQKASPGNHGDLPFVGMEHVEADTMRLLGTQAARSVKSAAVHFFPGDVLYGRLRPYLNKVLRPDFEGLASAEFIAMLFHEGIEPRYVQYLLNSSGFVAFASSLNAGDRPRVDYAQIATYQVPLAPLSEQQRIVSEIEKQLTRLDAAVAALKRVRANLKRYRASVLKAAVEGRLVPTEAEIARTEGHDYEPGDRLLARILNERRVCWESAETAKMRAAGRTPTDGRWRKRLAEPRPCDDSRLPRLPEGWLWTTLKALSWDAGYGTSEKCRYESDGPPVLRIPNIVDGNVDLNDVKHAVGRQRVANDAVIEPGDLLVVRTNGSRDLIGRAGLVRTRFDRPHYYASYLIRFRLVRFGVLPQWVACAWHSPILRGLIEERAATSAGQYNVSLTALADVSLPLPPLAEQERILEEVDRCLSIVAMSTSVLGGALGRADALRRAILARAFDGKLVPQDPTDEPARVLLERIRKETAATAEAAAVSERERRPGRGRRGTMSVAEVKGAAR